MQFADHLRRKPRLVIRRKPQLVIRRKPRLVIRDVPLRLDLNDIAGRKHGFFRRVESNRGSVANAAYPNCVFGIVAGDTLGPDHQQSTRRTEARLDVAQTLERVLKLDQRLPNKERLYIAKPDVKIAHVLPKMRDLGLKLEICPSTNDFSIC